MKTLTLSVTFRDLFLVLLGGCLSPLLLYLSMVYHQDSVIWDEGILLHAAYFGLFTFLAYVCYRVDYKNTE